MDAIDTFKVQALDSMAATIGMLQNEVAKSQEYLDRVQTRRTSRSPAAASTWVDRRAG